MNLIEMVKMCKRCRHLTSRLFEPVICASGFGQSEIPTLTSYKALKQDIEQIKRAF